MTNKIVCSKREVSNAIYSGIPGASLQAVDGIGVIWLIPCDVEIDIAFKIGGQTYPVHPLDTNADVLTNSDGQTCVGAVRLVLVKHISHPKPPSPVPTFPTHRPVLNLRSHPGDGIS